MADFAGDVLIFVVFIVAALIAGSFAIGLVLTVTDSVDDTVQEWKYRKHAAKEGRRIRKEERVRHIAALEEELGIGDKQ